MAGRDHVSRRRRIVRHPPAHDGQAGLVHIHRVLLPDVYYRSGEWAPFDMATVFGDESERWRLFGMIGALTPDKVASEARVLQLSVGSPRGFRRTFRRVRLLHGWANLAAGGGSRARPRRHCRVVPRRRPGHRGRGQPASARAPDDGHDLRRRRPGRRAFTTKNAEQLDKALTAAQVQHTIEWYPAARFRRPGQPALRRGGRRAALGGDDGALRMAQYTWSAPCGTTTCGTPAHAAVVVVPAPP